MHGAILAALRARDLTGVGQKLDGSLFETQVALLINVGLSWLNLGQEGERYAEVTHLERMSVCADVILFQMGHSAPKRSTI